MQSSEQWLAQLTAQYAHTGDLVTDVAQFLAVHGHSHIAAHSASVAQEAERLAVRFVVDEGVAVDKWVAIVRVGDGAERDALQKRRNETVVAGAVAAAGVIDRQSGHDNETSIFVLPKMVVYWYVEKVQ